MKKFLTIISLILLPEIVLGAIIDCPYVGFGGNYNLLNYPTSVEEFEKIEEIGKLISNIGHFIKECLVKPALIVVIIIAGIYILISTGDPSKVQKGKNIILAAIIGLIIIFAAEEIANLFSKYIH